MTETHQAIVQNHHNGGFSSGADDLETEKANQAERQSGRGGGGYRGNSRHNTNDRYRDNFRYNNRFITRTRGPRDETYSDENGLPNRRRSYSDGHGGLEADNVGGGDRRGGAYNQQRRRPRAFGGGGNGYRGGYAGVGYGPARRRQRDDDDARYQRRRFPPMQLRRNASADSQDGEAATKNGKEDQEAHYTTLPPEQFKRHFYSIKVSNLPKNKSLKGLYHHFACFGNVVNIHVLAEEIKKPTDEKDQASAEEEQHSKSETKQPSSEAAQKTEERECDAEETQSVVISYDSFEPARHVQRNQNGRVVFNHKIRVDRFVPPHFQRRSGDAKNRQRSHDPAKNDFSMSHLSDAILVPLFSMMDLQMRQKAASVCRSWHRAMQKVEVPARDVPDGLKVVLQKSTDLKQRQTVAVSFDKESKTFSLDYRPPSRFSSNQGSLEFRLQRLANQVGPGVESVQLTRINIVEHMLVVLGAFQRVKTIRLDNCRFVGRVNVGMVAAFLDHFKSRLVIEPSFELFVPPPVSSVDSRSKKSPSRSYGRGNKSKKVTTSDATAERNGTPLEMAQ